MNLKHILNCQMRTPAPKLLTSAGEAKSGALKPNPLPREKLGDEKAPLRWSTFTCEKPKRDRDRNSSRKRRERDGDRVEREKGWGRCGNWCTVGRREETISGKGVIERTDRARERRDSEGRKRGYGRETGGTRKEGERSLFCSLQGRESQKSPSRGDGGPHSAPLRSRRLCEQQVPQGSRGAEWQEAVPTHSAFSSPLREAGT
ncbi:unnamed protein product [Rangifer tarandus platyrhynchus]|uniref:Uncharacterized protein n=1 Tax=Rangifer tarandus platyrhynchus TaxID=3082113 RepID=A0ABN8YDB0_RANTA|nr:unnamed protein product [Rangifer tarandus platyrhynchus]